MWFCEWLCHKRGRTEVLIPRTATTKPRDGEHSGPVAVTRGLWCTAAVCGWHAAFEFYDLLLAILGHIMLGSRNTNGLRLVATLQTAANSFRIAATSATFRGFPRETERS